MDANRSVEERNAVGVHPGQVWEWRSGPSQWRILKVDDDIQGENDCIVQRIGALGGSDPYETRLFLGERGMSRWKLISPTPMPCPVCETRPISQSDYLCEECRYG